MRKGFFLSAVSLLGSAAAQYMPLPELKHQSTHSPSRQEMATFGAAVCAWEKAHGVECNVEKGDYPTLNFPKASMEQGRALAPSSVALGAYTAPGRREAFLEYGLETDYPLGRIYLARLDGKGWKVVASTGVTQDLYSDCINLNRAGKDTIICRAYKGLVQWEIKGQKLSQRVFLKMPPLPLVPDGSAACRAGTELNILAWDKRDRNGDGVGDLSLTVRVDQWKIREAKCSAGGTPERDSYYRKISSQTHDLIFYRSGEGFRAGPQTAAFVKKYRM